MARPDQSFYLAHFTKNGKEYNSDLQNDNPTVDQMSALDRLINILRTKTIYATPMKWTNQLAVCFTECPWSSLLQHAKNYSCYGIGFTKKFIFSRGGNPVIYANPVMYKSQQWSKEVYPFVTPLVPNYATEKVKGSYPFNGKTVDYSHEREWRVTKDLTFQFQNVWFIILDKVADLRKIPPEIIEEVGIEKFLFMDTYKKIEELWPTHLMN